MKKQFLSLFLLLLAPASLFAQTVEQDASIRQGKLKNGLTYYIRHNAKEAGLADFYIAQRVGSILEEPRQRGLAHFLEHMAFNGTKHFPGKGKQLGIVPWCETIGVKFGTNLNAYTSVDQTVYHIGSAPIKREGIIDSCLLVLNDWSQFINLEPKEIDKERGVIHEEWRNRRTGMAMQRMMENVMPKIYKGSKYEDCLPIGNMDIVDNFPYQDLRDYYQKWYRPDLQAIVVVGDFDVDMMERKIQKLFGKIKAHKNPAERIYYPVNDNDKMIVAIEKDKEQPIILGHLYMKSEATPDSEKNSVKYQREDYINGLITYMLNGRLSEKKQVANPPFMSATVKNGAFFVSRTKDAFSLSISCKQDNVLGGVSVAVGEVERARQHGFTQSELERAKKLYLNAAERQLKMEKDYKNSHYVSQCVNNFLEGEPILTPTYNLQLVKLFDGEVRLDEVNSQVGEIITDKNQVFIMYGPDKDGFVVPSESEIESTVLAAQQKRYDAYQEEQVPATLMAALPAPGKIVSEKPYGKFGMTEIVLSNGMKVYVKSTDYQADQITMSMRGEGGTSVYGDEDIPNFAFLSGSITEAGVGDFTATRLRKALAGKSLKLAPSITSEEQRITGTSSVKDLETMLQLAHLYFTAPRKDSMAFEGMMNRNLSLLKNRNASSKVVYNDSLSATLYDHNVRMAPVTVEIAKKADYNRIFEIYRERFSDASNFKTVFIGKVDMAQLRPLLCQYLATLPSTHKAEKSNKANVPQIVKKNEVVKFVHKQETPLANVSVFYTANVPFSPKNDLVLDMLTRVLQIAYTDSVREEKGGTYGVAVSFNLEKEDNPNALLRISYKSDPKRYEELNPVIYKQLLNIADHGPVASSMDKVKKYLKKQYGQMAITNDYWSYVIWHQLDDDADFDKDYCKMVDNLTASDVQKMAKELLKQNHRVEVTMLSE
uniref:M16 family metallopeptidase n=1 Tax=Prevotella sp. TaxID=59823 RepID=UPI004024E1E3